MSQSLDDILNDQDERLKELKVATVLLQNKETVASDLLTMWDDILGIKSSLGSMREDFETIRLKNVEMKRMLEILDGINAEIRHMEANIPPQLLQDYAKLQMSDAAGATSPASAKKNGVYSDDVFAEYGENNGMQDCKKILFKEQEKYPQIRCLEESEFKRLPKYQIGRQSIETVNSFVRSINDVLKVKYSIIALGKVAARKQKLLDRYMAYKEQEFTFCKDIGKLPYFTAAEYEQETKSKLNKAKLNLLTVLRHCKRLRDVRAGSANMLKAESVSLSTLSNDDDEIDDLDGSMIWSQEDPLSANEIMELEAPMKSSDPEGDAADLLCRLCAGRVVNPIYIYSEMGESMKLAHKVNTCLSVKIRKTDPLPKQLCLVCAEKIMYCDEFDTQCVRAEETLLTLLREKERHEIPELITNEILCDEKSCPLCLDGCMTTSQPNQVDPSYQELYDSDVVLDSSDEERAFQVVTADRESGNSIMLQCLGNRQQYLKCGACMNLYHTKETLDGHKCKPNVQSTSKPYKCSVCSITFTFEERLNFHMQFHAGCKALYCEICKTTFGKELKLFYHYKRYHCEDSTVSCLQCGKLFENQEELKRHVCVDGKTRPHVCEVCSKGFSDGYTLKRHIVTHLPEKPYKCGQCQKSFTQKSRLNKHVASHGVVIDESQTAWKCVECGEAFTTCDDADSHYKKHDEKITLIEELSVTKIYHCEFCDSFFTDLDSLKNHQGQHVVEKPYFCNQCQTAFKSYAEAVIHWKDHPRIFKIAVSFLCEICGKDMKELSLLYKHKQKRHRFMPRKSESGDPKYLCELCGKVFPAVSEIEEHGKEQCSKFPCDICGSLLPTANSLNAHKRRHSGLRPYVCNICGKSYTQSSHMWTHKRFHMGVKPYACEYCDQRFTIKPDLADHTRKKHTRERPFKCDVCNKAFLTGSVFYQHRLIHRGDRRYKCHYCEKAFTRTEALNNHIKIHTGEKPHACDVCGRCFRQKGDMRKHRRTQHVAKLEIS